MNYKKTLIYFVLIFSSLINTFTTAANERNICITTTPPTDICKTILIDPGHGGIDGGAESNKGILEKDINLSISLKLRDKLIESGYWVEMTREDDRGLNTTKKPLSVAKREDLNRRCKLKRDSNCDLFISIHQNHFPESKYHGAQVWYCVPEESKLLAEIIQKNLRNDLDVNNKREAKSAGNLYRILKCYCEIPSVIVECGFLSNREEAILLHDESYQLKIADSITKSVVEFFKHETESFDRIDINP